MKRFLLPLFLIPFSLTAQQVVSHHFGGRLTVGARSAVSLFNDESSMGRGYGGHVRLRLYDFLNTEWFADYITSDIDKLGVRTDYHVGWSVMFYMRSQHSRETMSNFRPYKVNPYFQAGHCFDFTRIANNNPFYGGNAEKWSSAIQAGFGMHIPLTPKLEISTSAQYMMHLGREIYTETRTAGNGDKFLYIATQDDAKLEGHLLLTASLNLYIVDLWKDKKMTLNDGPHIQEEQ
jgi:hypothetical protein